MQHKVKPLQEVALARPNSSEEVIHGAAPHC
jgi:hypothetical protein